MGFFESELRMNLVTGAGGFLGLYITEMLRARGEAVRAFCRKRYPELDALGMETVQGDLADTAAVEEACRGVRTIFHVAAISGMGEPWDKYYRTNTLGTQYLLESARKHGVQKFIFTSSPSVSFNGTHQRNADVEKTYPKRWLAHYPHSKALAEEMVLRANGVSGMLTCALRPHLIWGPRDQALIPRLIERAKTGRIRQVGSGKNLVDMIYVENAARAHLQAADALAPGAAVAGNAYFLSQGEPVACWPWINEILALHGLPPVKKRIPFAVAWWLGSQLEYVWRFFRLESDPLITRFMAAQLAKDHYYDISRARQDFGYTPAISTAEGMAALAEEIRQKQEQQPGT